MTMTVKSILASLTVLGVAEGADIPEWMTRWLLVGALGVVQFFFSRQVAALDKKVEAFDQHVKDTAVMKAEMNVIQAIGALKVDLALSDKVTRLDSAVATAAGEVSKLREHWHEMARTVSSFEAKLATLSARNEGRPP